VTTVNREKRKVFIVNLRALPGTIPDAAQTLPMLANDKTRPHNCAATNPLFDE
jgi:hypothetical protein